MKRLFGLLSELTRPAVLSNLEARIEPTVPRQFTASPFEMASDELARDGARRFSSAEQLRARVKGILSADS